MSALTNELNNIHDGKQFLAFTSQLVTAGGRLFKKKDDTTGSTVELTAIMDKIKEINALDKNNKYKIANSKEKELFKNIVIAVPIETGASSAAAAAKPASSAASTASVATTSLSSSQKDVKQSAASVVSSQVASQETALKTLDYLSHEDFVLAGKFKGMFTDASEGDRSRNTVDRYNDFMNITLQVLHSQLSPYRKLDLLRHGKFLMAWEEFTKTNSPNRSGELAKAFADADSSKLSDGDKMSLLVDRIIYYAENNGELNFDVCDAVMNSSKLSDAFKVQFLQKVIGAVVSRRNSETPKKIDDHYAWQETTNKKLSDSTQPMAQRWESLRAELKQLSELDHTKKGMW